jgi:N-acetylglucosaminyl-diphospho-decaprenol L-rhamnosyltransferase
VTPRPPPGICAVVVSHESAATIDDCLQRLRAAQDVAEIRVVDNGSRDGTLAMVQRHASADPRLHFIGNPDNPGFSAACNQGVRDGNAPWIAFVNPDCLLEADALTRLLRHAQAAGGNAVLGADLVDEDGRRDSAARRRAPDFAAMLSSRAARDLSLAVAETQALQPVEALSGALMLVPCALFERIGGFDEGYRLHAEDLDLCRRLRDAGARLFVANDVRVVHVRGVSSRARPLFVEWHKHRGLWRYFRKFEAPRRGLATRTAVFAMIWLRFPFAALRAALHAAENR